MAKVSAHGTALFTYFSVRRRGLARYMSDGTILRRTPWQSGWRVYGKTTPERIAKIVAEKEAWIAGRPAWLRDIRSLPPFRTLVAWEADGICETPTGHRVESDGTGPDGCPSWLRLLSFI